MEQKPTELNADELNDVVGGVGVLPQEQDCPYCEFTCYNVKELLLHMMEFHPEEMDE